MEQKKCSHFRKRIFDIIQIGNKEDIPSRAFDIIIVIMIILNITSMFLETFSGLSKFSTVFHIVEIATVAFFCIEYILRIWTANLLYPDSSKKKAIVKFILSYDGIIDLFTILPLFFLSGFIVFRMLRVVRIFHLFRINAQYDSFNVITSVLIEKRKQIMSSLFIIIILMFASSIEMYNVEHEAQPEIFANAFSGLWWSMSTLLTVGYGDIYPITTLGQIMAIFIAFLGVGVVAIPTGIISAGFVEHYTKKANADELFVDVKEIGEILVDKDSKLVDKTIGDVQKEFSVQIVVVLRDNLTIIATNQTLIKEGDVLVLRSTQLVK